MKKTKSLGPSNDSGVPTDEIILAKLIQNAGSRGLVSTKDTYFAVGDLTLGSRARSRPDITACCALGARLIDRRGIPKLNNMVSGNDATDGDSPASYMNLDGWNVGAAFEQALRPESTETI